MGQETGSDWYIYSNVKKKWSTRTRVYKNGVFFYTSSCIWSYILGGRYSLK